MILKKFIYLYCLKTKQQFFFLQTPLKITKFGSGKN